MVTTIFIDANLLIREGKIENLDRQLVKLTPTLERLSYLATMKVVRILLTDLTLDEVAKMFATLKTKLVPDLAQPNHMAAFKEIYGIEPTKKSNQSINDFFLEAERKKVSKLAEQIQAIVLKIDDISPSEVMNDFTEKKGMFSKSTKKDQFPDAFLHKMIKREQSAGYHGVGEVIIVTDDSDFDNVIKNDSSLRRLKNLVEVLEEIDDGVEDPPVIMKFLKHAASDIEAAFDEELNGWSLTDPSVEDLEVYQSEVSNLELVNIECFGEISKGKTVLVTGMANLQFLASYTHPDWSMAIYDSEAGVRMAFETVKGEADTEIVVDFTMSLLIRGDGDHKIEAVNFVGPKHFEYSLSLFDYWE